MYGAENAGNIRYQLGNVLLARTEAIKIGDVPRVIDLTVAAIDVCAPKIQPEEERTLETIMAPARERYGLAERGKDREALSPELMRASSLMIRALLRLMASRGLYAFLDTKATDASSLTLTGEDDAEDNIIA